MTVRLLLAADDSLSAENLNSCFDLCSTLATVIGEPVYLATLDPDSLDDLRAWVLLKTEGKGPGPLVRGLRRLVAVEWQPGRR